jgi:hypothetical protein
LISTGRTSRSPVRLDLKLGSGEKFLTSWALLALQKAPISTVSARPVKFVRRVARSYRFGNLRSPTQMFPASDALSATLNFHAPEKA